jgi:hypothetical protein
MIKSGRDYQVNSILLLRILASQQLLVCQFLLNQQLSLILHLPEDTPTETENLHQDFTIRRREEKMYHTENNMLMNIT